MSLNFPFSDLFTILSLQFHKSEKHLLSLPLLLLSWGRYIKMPALGKCVVYVIPTRLAACPLLTAWLDKHHKIVAGCAMPSFWLSIYNRGTSIQFYQVVLGICWRVLIVVALYIQY